MVYVDSFKVYAWRFYPTNHWPSSFSSFLFSHLQDIWSDKLYPKDGYQQGTKIPLAKVK